MSLALLLALALGGLPLGAQELEDEEEMAAPVPEVDVEEILAAEEEMLAGGGYTYDDGNRRDPFKSLLAARERPTDEGPRPEGIPGLLIDEIDLTGIFITVDGPVAQVQSSGQDKSYLVRPGDQLYDGDVVSISSTEVAFKQIVNDPTALKPFREVVKKLEP
jgi:hypothetical protein